LIGTISLAYNSHYKREIKNDGNEILMIILRVQFL